MIRLLLGVLGHRGRNQLRRVIGLFGLVGVLQGAAFVLLVPVLDALFRQDWNQAWTWIAVLAVVLLLHHAVLLYSSMDGYRLSSTVLQILLHRLGDHVARLPLGWFGPDRTGSLGRMVSKGSVDIAAVPSHLLRSLITAVVTPLTVMITMFFLRWQLGLTLLIGILILTGTARLLSGIVGRGENSYDASIADGSGRVIEFALNQSVLRVFGRTGAGNRLVADALDEQERTQKRLQITGFGGVGIMLVALQALLTVIIALAVSLTLGGNMNAATMIGLLVLAVRFVEPLLSIGELTGVLRMARGSLERVLELLDTPALAEPEHPRSPADSGVEMRHVTFAYDSGPRVLEDVSFTAPPRSLTAVIGPSGSGKSTLLRLIARFYDLPTSPRDNIDHKAGSGAQPGGAVLVGGCDVRDLGTEALISQIGIVFQDVYLFEGTLRDNVLMSRPDASDVQLAQAARLARVDDIVQRLPQGWHTRVGEAGNTLSGGEKQRISIARALLKDAPIVLLDEATAALDPENEAAVQQALSALAADRTVIVIAHRLQTVVAADQILVLDGGRIVERGTHDELFDRGGRYRDFWDQRTQAAGWRLVTPTT